MKSLRLMSSRRKFLKFGTIPLLSFTTILHTGCGTSETEKLVAERRLIALLNHLEKAREIGNFYKLQNNTIKSYTPEQLKNEILLWLNLDQKKMKKLSDEELAELMRKQVRKDFSNEDIVTMGTWIFSKTEMLLCALAHSHPTI